MVINHSVRFLFVHNPKTAGTSLSRALLSLPGSLRPEGLPTHADARQAFEHFGLAKLAGYFKFGLVRNPWARLVSQYVFMLQRATARLRDRAQSKAVKGGISEADDLRESTTLQSLGFEGWLLETEYQVDVYGVDFKKRPQLSWLSDSQGRRLVDYVGRMEDLDDVADFLTQRLAKSIRLQRSNATDHGDYRAYYTRPESRHFVARHFAADIEAFGYRF